MRLQRSEPNAACSLRSPVRPRPVVSRLVAGLVTALSWLATDGVAAPREPGGDEAIVWVRFRDRGPLERASWAERRRVARAQLSERSWRRRARRTGSDQPLETDLPVAESYLRTLVGEGVSIRAVSRWRNAVSIVADPTTLARIGRLPFVAGWEPVLRLRRRVSEDWESAASAPPLDPRRHARSLDDPRFPVQDAPGTPGFYGASYAQSRILGVDALHAQGLSGQGVLIAVLDTGFRETHTAFDSLEVLARRDFINGDEIVANQDGQDPVGFNQESHGSYVLSTIAGYWPGIHVGTAYRAQVALGKTEYGPSETVVEMDYWQTGAEWADSLGADVVSSSLGYSQFDTPGDSYAYTDLDGKTTVVTLAAVEAARRGITVVTAQGNDGNTSWHFLIAPADGDSVCAVGAVDSLGNIASFSSYGPSADGRVKPDVCAMGVSVQTISVSSDANFIRPSGTSFATPATAGLVALLLEAHPTWGPFEVLEALRSTADRAGSPTDQYGYGIARGPAALAWVPSTVGVPSLASRDLSFEVLPAAAGRSALRFHLRSGTNGGSARLDLFDVRGRLVEKIWRGTLAPGEERSWVWTNPARLARGAYWVRLVTADGELSRRATIL